MSDAIIEQIDKTIEANDTVLKDVMILNKRNEELRLLRLSLATGNDALF